MKSVLLAFSSLSLACAWAVTPAAEIRVPEGFKVELLKEAGPRDGSWICMTADAAGRLYISPQGSIPETGFSKESTWGGLVRATVSEKGVEKWERVPVPVGDAMGMLWAFDSLYVSGNGPQGRGIYRCKDTNGDSLPDTATLWKAVSGGAGEHGAHALVLGPDQKSIFIVHGNSTPLIDGVSADSPYRNWGEDDLLPKLKDPVATFFDKIKTPYGYVVRTDENGTKWDLIAGGFRNPYDIDFNAAGDLFTYDSDMEWDRGLPWYRPSRVLHVVAGGEYGFREGSAKWPDWYPDSMPAVCDIGLGCPTGVKFGTTAKGWPMKYRSAFFICDWTFGRVLAVHMTEKGLTYTAANPLKSYTFPKDAEASSDVEVFLSGKGMPVTDVEFGADGAMYLTVGGRGTAAGLYRVSYLKAAENIASGTDQGPVKLPSTPVKVEAPVVVPPTPNPTNAKGEKTIENRGADLEAYFQKAAPKAEELNDPKVIEQARARVRQFTTFTPAKEIGFTGSLFLATNAILRQTPQVESFLSMTGEFLQADLLKSAQQVKPAAEHLTRKDLAPAVKEFDQVAVLGFANHVAYLGRESGQLEVLNALKLVPLAELTEARQLVKLRVLQISFARQGRPPQEWVKVGLEKLLARYPAQGPEAAKLNRELSPLLIWLSNPELGDLNPGQPITAESGKPLPPGTAMPNPGAVVHAGRKGDDFQAELGRTVIERTLALLEAAPTQEEQIYYALNLRWAHGWTPELRARYFRWFNEKAARYTGGNSFVKFVDKIRTEALSRVPEADRAALSGVKAVATSNTPSAPVPTRTFVKAWTLPELETALDGLKNRAPDLGRGKQLYTATQCAQCHLFREGGGNVGPDLTAVAQRFGRKDILEAILDPNKVVSDQYAMITLTVTKFGGGGTEQVSGLIQEETSATVTLLTDPVAGKTANFYTNVIQKREKANVSIMPPALLYTLTAEEVADLLAYLGSK